MKKPPEARKAPTPSRVRRATRRVVESSSVWVAPAVRFPVTWSPARRGAAQAVDRTPPPTRSRPAPPSRRRSAADDTSVFQLTQVGTPLDDGTVLARPANPETPGAGDPATSQQAVPPPPVEERLESPGARNASSRGSCSSRRPGRLRGRRLTACRAPASWFPVPGKPVLRLDPCYPRRAPRTTGASGSTVVASAPAADVGRPSLRTPCFGGVGEAVGNGGGGDGAVGLPAANPGHRVVLGRNDANAGDTEAFVAQGGAGAGVARGKENPSLAPGVAQQPCSAGPASSTGPGFAPTFFSEAPPPQSTGAPPASQGQVLPDTAGGGGARPHQQ